MTLGGTHHCMTAYFMSSKYNCQAMRKYTNCIHLRETYKKEVKIELIEHIVGGGLTQNIRTFLGAKSSGNKKNDGAL